MKWLNYNHLHYFWVVAREGGVVRASEELLVSQPTISNQLKELEASLGHRLFDRVGRGLRLTEVGRVAFNYANEIFSLGQELIDAIKHQPPGRPLRLSVGLLDVLPKTVVHRLLAPALSLEQPVRLVIREDKADRLLGDLAARRTDVVLSDAPIGTAVQLRGFNHLLAECGVTFLATAKLAASYRRGFPKSLDGAPILLPAEGTALRRELNLWFDAKRIHPIVVGEFDDGATLSSFGRAGAGVFPAPSLVEEEICREHQVQVVGRSDKIRQRFYGISVEENLKHPAVAAILQAARRRTSGRKSAPQAPPAAL